MQVFILQADIVMTTDLWPCFVFTSVQNIVIDGRGFKLLNSSITTDAVSTILFNLKMLFSNNYIPADKLLFT